ncbi:SDR family oxidoreductase [Streptomyces sp. NPDC058247]|uniref:SDR family oxidoreductase n=1 Tax=Streptomyces sp. NPDC058247 TaxID=3346401 RepID=UPI0036EC8248
MVATNHTAADGSVGEEAHAKLITERAGLAALGNAIGTPRDIAPALLYLASDASSFETGQTLRPNGGTSMG